MNLYNSETWIEDIDKVIAGMPELEKLSGKSILVTGAAGLICSAVVDVLLRYNETEKGRIRVFAAGRSEKKMRLRFGKLLDRPDCCFVPYDAEDSECTIREKADYIIHGAGNASPDKIGKEPVETMYSSIRGLLALLHYAKSIDSKRLLYISSSEIYGKRETSSPHDEQDFGYIDLLNPRSSYPIGKMAGETLAASFAEEYKVDSVIVRPGHIYGPTASEGDNRVSSAWPIAVAKGEDIVMKSDGKQLRSYVYCLDCAAAILTVLLKGNCREAYNISNPDSIISIREMAEYLCDTAHVRLRMNLPTETEKKQFNPMSNSSLSSVKLEHLGWSACFDAETGFKHTVKIIKECM